MSLFVYSSYFVSFVNKINKLLPNQFTIITKMFNIVSKTCRNKQFRKIHHMPNLNIVPQGLWWVHCCSHLTLLSKMSGFHPDIKCHFYADDAQLYVHASDKNHSPAPAWTPAFKIYNDGWLSTNWNSFVIKQNLLFLGLKAHCQKLCWHFPVNILGSLQLPTLSET